VQPLPTVEIFVLGIIGGFAPEALRLFSLKTQPDRFRWSWNYVFLSIPFLIISGVIAVVLPAVSTWGAFYAGVSAPVVINTALRQGINTARRSRRGVTPLATEKNSGVKAFLQAL
jgi:hypothetical protein